LYRGVGDQGDIRRNIHEGADDQIVQIVPARSVAVGGVEPAVGGWSAP